MARRKALSTFLRRKKAFLLLCIFPLCLSSCKPKLEKAFQEEQSIQRLSSITVEEDIQNSTKSFAKDLAIPSDTSAQIQDMDAEYFLLVEEDSKEGDRAISFNHPYDRTYPASITKLMTALVCVSSVENLDQEFVVSGSSVNKEAGSSTAFLQVGESLSIRNLLYGMLLPSGNDAAVAVAEATAGSVSAFVDRMNEKALELGCLSSHFTNPHGLPDDNHYTSPYDIYLILKECMKYDSLREILATKEIQVQYKDKNGIPKSQVWKATNLYSTGEKELPDGLEILAAKTGTTKKAGYCLALTVDKASTAIPYYSVVMKGTNKENLYENMTNLLDKIS